MRRCNKVTDSGVAAIAAQRCMARLTLNTVPALTDASVKALAASCGWAPSCWRLGGAAVHAGVPWAALARTGTSASADRSQRLSAGESLCWAGCSGWLCRETLV